MSDENAFNAFVGNFRGANTSHNENERGTNGDRNGEKSRDVTEDQDILY